MRDLFHRSDHEPILRVILRLAFFQGINLAANTEPTDPTRPNGHTNPNPLVRDCIQRQPFAWHQLVDRYLPAVVKVIQEISEKTGQHWAESRQQELAVDFFRTIHANDYQLLREMDPMADFETWLVIAARRSVLSRS